MGQSSIEVTFEPGVVEVEGRAPIKYEWALQQVEDNYRLVFHFFLGLKREDLKFTKAMNEAAMAVTNVTHDHGQDSFEIHYTGEYGIDGHGLTLEHINVFARDSIKNRLLEELKKALVVKK